MTTIIVSFDAYGETRETSVFIPSARPSLEQVYTGIDRKAALICMNARKRGQEVDKKRTTRLEVSEPTKGWQPVVAAEQLLDGCRVYAFRSSDSEGIPSRSARVATKSGAPFWHHYMEGVPGYDKSVPAPRFHTGLMTYDGMPYDPSPRRTSIRTKQ
eukprot:TRINITY_DN22624_c0_g1_i1.p1 TRINITY_DN22624_c0_g1~~TRINITY_DN22624_c0_g1_i1.p1  ORF type:complete len:165 (+),score=21.07 TRINITY_DN22624_c0_g1_i1:25-495(+)